MIRVYGIRRVVERLEEIKDKAEGFIEQGIEEAGRECVERAKELVPVRTGRLRDSIGMRRIGAGKIVVEAKAPYAGYVEYGTRYMKPRPYMRPATREAYKKLRQKLAKII